MADEIEVFNDAELQRKSFAEQITDEFAPYEVKINAWIGEASRIRVHSVDDKEAMAKAKELGKFVSSTLTKVENRRKQLKRESLDVGRAIDAAANKFKGLLEPLRDDLKAKAEFEKRLLEAQANEKRLYRVNAMAQYGGLVDAETMMLSDEEFEELVADTKAKKEKADVEYENQLAERRKVDNLYKERLQKINTAKLFEFVNPSDLATIGTIGLAEFNALISVATAKQGEAIKKEIAEKSRRDLNDMRLELLKGYKLPDTIDAGTLYMYTADEFAELLRYIKGSSPFVALKTDPTPFEPINIGHGVNPEQRTVDNLAKIRQGASPEQIDRELLKEFAESLFGIEIPTVHTEKGHEIGMAIVTMIGKMNKYINDKADSL